LAVANPRKTPALAVRPARGFWFFITTAHFHLSYEQKEIERTPRISVNKLADYLSTASTSKRRSILREQKFPKDSEIKVVYYNEAKQPIKKCFATSAFTFDSISKAIRKLRAEIDELNLNQPETVEEIGKHKSKLQRKESCLEVLDIFLENIDMLDKYKTNDFSSTIPNGAVEINGVKISVDPDVIIKGSYRGKSYTGALKLYFSKSNKLTTDMGKTISSVVYEHLKGFHPDANNKHCFVYDVVNSKIHFASLSYAKKIKEIQEACEDIAILWPNIKKK
jgi:hypothetical protein